MRGREARLPRVRAGGKISAVWAEAHECRWANGNFPTLRWRRRPVTYRRNQFGRPSWPRSEGLPKLRRPVQFRSASGHPVTLSTGTRHRGASTSSRWAAKLRSASATAQPCATALAMLAWLKTDAYRSSGGQFNFVPRVATRSLYRLAPGTEAPVHHLAGRRN